MRTTSEPESAETSTGLRLRKCSSQQLAEKIQTGKWWPFEKADPEKLEQIERLLKKKEFAALPEAPY
jgi:hypothetical protein